MKTKIKLSDSVVKEIIIDAESNYPNEGCGFLYGSDTSIRTIAHFEPVRNTIEGDQRRSFEISPKDYMKAEQIALEKGMDLLGIYHSHPDYPAIASTYDLNKALPFFSYIIVSVLKGKADHIYSWRLFDNYRSFYQEDLFIKDLIISQNK
jgi:proteasome lid subunit RPN8/RPN11